MLCPFIESWEVMLVLSTVVTLGAVMTVMTQDGYGRAKLCTWDSCGCVGRAEAGPLVGDLEGAGLNSG